MTDQAPVGERTAPSPGQTKITINDMPWQDAKTAGVRRSGPLPRRSDRRVDHAAEIRAGGQDPLHEHTGLEQTFVLDGSLTDRDGTI